MKTPTLVPDAKSASEGVTGFTFAFVGTFSAEGAASARTTQSNQTLERSVVQISSF